MSGDALLWWVLDFLNATAPWPRYLDELYDAAEQAGWPRRQVNQACRCLGMAVWVGHGDHDTAMKVGLRRDTAVPTHVVW